MKLLLHRTQIRLARGVLVVVCFQLALASSSGRADPSFQRFNALTNTSGVQLHRPNGSLTPTRMMSNEQLFLSADALRSKQVSPIQLRANHFWLRSQVGDCYEGSAALRKFLRVTLSNFYPSLNHIVEDFRLNEEDETQRESSFSLKQLDNYSMRLSQRRVSFRFKYEF